MAYNSGSMSDDSDDMHRRPRRFSLVPEDYLFDFGDYNILPQEDNDMLDSMDSEAVTHDGTPSKLAATRDVESKSHALVRRGSIGDRGPSVRAMTCILTSKLFQMAMALCIVANGIVIGLETDHPNHWYWEPVENVFLIMFLVEVSLRIIIMTPQEFFINAEGHDWAWNMFDFIVVSIGVFDAVLDLFRSGNGGSFALAFRIIRLLRIMRLFRIVRYLKQLYVLAHGIFLSALALFWVTLLMIFILYVCSVVLVRTVSSFSEDHPDHEFLKANFGNIFQSMFTLFQLMTNPTLDDYYLIFADPQQIVLSMFVVGFVVFGSFGMIAVLSGVMQEGMFQKNLVRLEMDRAERSARRKLLVNRCTALFNEIPHTESGEARTEEVLKLLPKIASLFEANGVPFVHEDLEACIQIMDTDFSGEISKEEFVHFLLQVSELVRPILVLELRHSVNSFTRSEMQDTRDLIKEVRKKVDRIEAFARAGRLTMAGPSPPGSPQLSPKLSPKSQALKKSMTVPIGEVADSLPSPGRRASNDAPERAGRNMSLERGRAESASQERTSPRLEGALPERSSPRLEGVRQRALSSSVEPEKPALLGQLREEQKALMAKLVSGFEELKAYIRDRHGQEHNELRELFTMAFNELKAASAERPVAAAAAAPQRVPEVGGQLLAGLFEPGPGALSGGLPGASEVGAELLQQGSPGAGPARPPQSAGAASPLQPSALAAVGVAAVPRLHTSPGSSYSAGSVLPRHPSPGSALPRHLSPGSALQRHPSPGSSYGAGPTLPRQGSPGALLSTEVALEAAKLNGALEGLAAISAIEESGRAASRGRSKGKPMTAEHSAKSTVFSGSPASSAASPPSAPHGRYFHKSRTMPPEVPAAPVSRWESLDELLAKIKDPPEIEGGLAREPLVPAVHSNGRPRVSSDPSAFEASPSRMGYVAEKAAALRSGMPESMAGRGSQMGADGVAPFASSEPLGLGRLAGHGHSQS